MISVDQFITLLQCSMPVIVIIVVAIYMIRHRKDKNSDVDTMPCQLFGMRSPTLEEAEKIKKQVLPRISKSLIVLSLVMIPMTVIIAGAAISIYDTEGLGIVVILGSVGGAVLMMYIGMVSMPIYQIWSLQHRLYTVTDCYFDDIQTYIRYTPRGMPVKIYHAVVRDEIGLSWELDLPKDLQRSLVGDKCMVIIYASEEKVNKARSKGKSLYRRALYVPEDQHGY